MPTCPSRATSRCPRSASGMASRSSSATTAAGWRPGPTARASASGCRSSPRWRSASRSRRGSAAARACGWPSRWPRAEPMAEPTTRPAALVVSDREALELLTRAGVVLAGSLDSDETLARAVDLVVPGIADWCGLYVAAGDGGERGITSRHADPRIESMLVEIRRRRRDGQGDSETLRVLHTGQSILATDVASVTAADLSADQRAEIARMGPR